MTGETMHEFVVHEIQGESLRRACCAPTSSSAAREALETLAVAFVPPVFTELHQRYSLVVPCYLLRGGLAFHQVASRVNHTPSGVLAVARTSRGPQVAYANVPAIVSNGCLLMIDEVIATGASMIAAVRALSHAGLAAVAVAAPFSTTLGRKCLSDSGLFEALFTVWPSEPMDASGRLTAFNHDTGDSYFGGEHPTRIRIPE